MKTILLSPSSIRYTNVTHHSSMAGFGSLWSLAMACWCCDKV